MNLKIKRGFKFLLIFIFFVILFFNKPQNEWFYNAYLLIYPTWIDLISDITNILKLNVGDLLYLVSLPIIFNTYTTQRQDGFFFTELDSLVFLFIPFFILVGVSTIIKNQLIKNMHLVIIK